MYLWSHTLGPAYEISPLSYTPSDIRLKAKLRQAHPKLEVSWVQFVELGRRAQFVELGPESEGGENAENWVRFESDSGRPAASICSVSAKSFNWEECASKSTWYELFFMILSSFYAATRFVKAQSQLDHSKPRFTVNWWGSEHIEPFKAPF